MKYKSLHNLIEKMDGMHYQNSRRAFLCKLWSEIWLFRFFIIILYIILFCPFCFNLQRNIADFLKDKNIKSNYKDTEFIIFKSLYILNFFGKYGKFIISNFQSYHAPLPIHSRTRFRIQTVARYMIEQDWLN